MQQTTLDQPGDNLCDWLEFQRRVLLGRSLFLGNDELNGIIALQQCGYNVSDGHGFHSKMACHFRRSDKTRTYHFCKALRLASARDAPRNTGQGSEMKQARMNLLKYLRSLYFDVPEHYVALGEGNYMPRVAWLEKIISTGHVKPTAERQTQDQRTFEVGY
jgi:hypothetical protein